MSIETMEMLQTKSEGLRKELLQLIEKMASEKANIEKEIAEVHQVEIAFKNTYKECEYKKISLQNSGNFKQCIY
jgi:uncharacterized protein (UPF0335 family)